MSRPRDLGELSCHVHGKKEKKSLRLQNIGSRQNVEDLPVRLHFIDTQGRVRSKLHDIFPCNKMNAPSSARVVAFRHFSVETSEDELLIRVRRGIIDAAIFAQHLSVNIAHHLQLISSFMAMILKQSLCDCGCNGKRLNKRYSQSLQGKVLQLLNGIIINNGAFMAWDTSLDGSIAADLKKVQAEINGPQKSDAFDDDEDLLDEQDIRAMKRFDKRFSNTDKMPQSYLQGCTPMLVWNAPQMGSLKELSDEPNANVYQRKIEQAINEVLQREAA